MPSGGTKISLLFHPFPQVLKERFKIFGCFETEIGDLGMASIMFDDNETHRGTACCLLLDGLNLGERDRDDPIGKGGFGQQDPIFFEEDLRIIAPLHPPSTHHHINGTKGNGRQSAIEQGTNHVTNR